MITCAIIDDEPLAVRLLESYACKTPALCLRGCYSSAVQAMKELRDYPVDLLFLDIQMPELNGLEFARILNPGTRIIFTTAFDRYAVEGFKVNAIDYLLKPISYTDFLTAVEKALRWFDIARAAASGHPDKGDADSLFVKSDYKFIRLKFSDILYVEGLKDYVKIYPATGARPILSLTSMSAVEKALPPERFLRIHRSYIVNMEQVSVLERGQVLLGEKRLPVSDSYKERVQEYIGRRLLNGRGT